MKTQESNVIQFIRIAWASDSKSWHLYNTQVRRAVEICAEGFDWHSGDIDTMLKVFSNRRFNILKCLTGGGLEAIYTIAVMSGNLSYCLEYERYCTRKPIIVDNVNDLQRDRLCIGSKFRWNGEDVAVTSFNNGLAVACSYKTVKEGATCPKCGCCTSHPREKIRRRYTISAEDVQRDRKKRRKIAEAKEK